MLLSNNTTYSIESSKPEATYKLSKELENLLAKNTYSFNDIIVFCIGTDRSTGDCLGPLVGDKLSKIRLLHNVTVFGTLKEPVHAKNITEYTERIYDTFEHPFIIAIDASLGKTENIGKINLFRGPIFPGSGVNKNIIPVGDLSITGIVNISGFMEYIILQNTRLSLVMQMADIISMALYISLKKLVTKAPLNCDAPLQLNNIKSGLLKSE
jgi:putative sporulation protein YyaC